MIATAILIAALRGSVIILIAAIAAWALRSKPAALRHSIWSIAIASQLVLPIAPLLMPQRAVQLGPLSDAYSRVAAVTVIPGAGTNQQSPGAPSTVAPVASPTTSPIAPKSTVSGFELAGTLQLVTLLWAAGALLMLLRFGIGTILVARETRLASRPVSREWVVLAGQIQEEMDLNREAMLRWGTKREVPYTWGLISPAVCLPADADKWSLERLRIVMIHELAHVQRLDTVGELVAQVALVIFWFNPLLWLAVRRMRTEREHACDDRVLMRGVKPSTYVDELVMMMKSIGSGGMAPGFGAIAMARRSQFEDRMFAVLDEHADRRSVGRRSITAVVVAAIVLLLGVASVRPAAAGPALPQVAGAPQETAGVHVRAQRQDYSDFDELVADCRRKQPKLGVRYCEVRTVDLSGATGQMEFDGGRLGGAIFTTKGSARTPSARVLVGAEAVTSDDAQKLARQVSTFYRNGVLQADGPGNGGSYQWSVLYEVTLPVGASVRARSELSQISLDDFTGTADVSSVNGPVEVYDAAGDIRGRTQNGPIMVGLGGNHWEGAGLDLRSQNGPVYLSIPPNYSAHLITGTINGPLSVRYPIVLKRMSGRGIEADVGSGGTTVRVSTVNGPADIR